MARVSLSIGGVSHDVACRDGDEEPLRRAAALVDSHWEAARPLGQGQPGRTMVLAALTLADALLEAEAPRAPAPQDAALLRVAERLEALAETLEQQAGSH